jgi:hypothetical protein
MTAINFPSSPVNGDTLTSGNTTYTYNAAKTRWDAVTTVNGIQLNSLSVGAEAPASGDGGIAYNNTSGVFTYTPPVSADPLPTQTGNTGKYLTTDGSTTSWAAVSAGAGYEIGDGLELQGVTSYDWSTLPAPTASFIGTTINGQLGSLLAASSSYVVTVLRGPDTTFGVYNAQTGSFERSITKPGSGNTYGGKLDISGTKIIFGNYESSGNAGAAAIFEATTGNQIHSLSTTGTAYAGAGVAISPTYAAVNSFSADNVDSYVDIYSVSTGNKIYTISNPDIVPTGGEATFDDSFGIIISMSDSYLVVAALNEEAADGTTNSGVVYVFDTPTGTLLHTLIPSSPVANAQYGYTVALHGDYIAVGTSAGPYVFIYSASTGSLLRTISDPQPGDNKFGSGWAPRSAISIDGNYLLVGAPNTNPSVELEVSGAAYLFDITNGNLLHTISATSSRQGLGSATALAPGVLAVASKYFDNGSSDSEADYGKIDLYKTNTSTINYLKPDSTIATTSYVDTAVSNLVDSSPAALNTLNELAAALGDDANFSTTVTNTLATKAPLASPTFTGVPVAPTATAGTNTTQIATTAFVTAATVAAAGDTLPAQTDNAGKYLTTDGSTTSWAEIVSTGGSKEFIANGAIAAGAPVVLDPAGTVSPVATIAANGTEMAAGHQALFPAIGMTSMAIMLTHNTNYSTYKRAATCPITGRSVFFGEMSTLLNMNSNYRTRRVIQGSAPNASATEMILGPLVELSDAVAGANMHNVCFSGNGDGVFIITYQTATAYNNTASAGLAARLGKVDSSGNITMFNTETVKVGRPSNYNSQYSDSSSVANQWLNSIVWDPIASKFVIVYTGYSWLTDGVKAQTTIGTALYSYDNSNTLSPAGGQGLTSLGYYGSSNTKLKALWDSTRERVTTIFFGQDRRYLSNFTSDNYFHESIFDVIDGEIQPLVPITAPIPYVSTTTAVWAFQTDMEYNPTQGTFLLLPESSNSNESIFYSFAFDGSAVSSLVAVGRPSTLLKGIDNTGISYYRDIIYEASSDSITIAYSAPNMTYGGTHANKNSIYTATLDASDYTSVLSNIEAYDASWRGNTTLFNYGTSYARVGVAAAQYVELNWSPILNKFLMYRQTDELDSYQVNYSYTQSTSDRYRDAYDLVQVISVSNYPQAIGFSEGTVSDGTPVPVTLAGGVNTNQSGLSIERNYYFQTDGSLGINSTDYLVGLALSATELQVADLSDLDNVNLSLYATTSALASKAPLASPTFTGVPVAPTATAGTNTTQLATTAFVTAATVAAAGDTLPTQTGNTGKYLTTDGSTTSWAAVASGSSYTIGTNLQAVDTITSVTWPASPELVTRIDGSGTELVGGDKIFLSANYLVAKRNNQNDGSASGSNNTVFQVYSKTGAALLRTITAPMYTEATLYPIDAASVYKDYLVVAESRMNYSTGGNLYVYNLATGALVTTLTPEANTRFMSAALGENKIAVVLYESSNTVGSIRVYNLTTGELISSGSAPAGVNASTVGFGRTLAMSGDYITVGAPESGRAYIYNSNTCALLHTLGTGLTPGVIKTGFSNRLDMDGDNIIVGTVGLGNPEAAHAHIFSASTGSLLRTIVYSDANNAYPSTDDSFGRQCLKISGNYALIGVHNEDSVGDNAGMAILYNITDGSIVYSIQGEDADDLFGDQGDISGGTIAISARNVSGSNAPGYIKVYQGVEVSETILSTTSAVATTSYVDTAVSNLVDSSPAALNTLNELAAALGDDANFATTVTNTLAEKAPLASPTFTGVTTLTATSEVLQPKFSAGFGAVDHDIANGSIFYHDNMMGNFDAAFINVPTTVDLVTSAVLVMADGQMWGPSSYVRVNGTEYVVKWLGGTAPTMSADVVDVVSYSLINRNGTWVVIGSHSAYSAAV